MKLNPYSIMISTARDIVRTPKPTIKDRHYWALRLRLAAHEIITPGNMDCGYNCHVDEKFGFVPEADCPVHDVKEINPTPQEAKASGSGMVENRGE